MEIGIQMMGMDKVRDLVAALGGNLRQAEVAAINDTAFYVRQQMQDAMRAAFDRPTSYILRSPRFARATLENPQTFVMPTMRDTRDGRASTGGKIGVDPQQILQAQEFGGSRANKRSEVALQRAGILPAGYQTAIPDDARGGPYPGSTDGHGNLRGAFVAQLISYLQASSEQGFKQNMTPENIAARARHGRTKAGYKTIRGVVYFVRGVDVRGRPGPGIWAKSGIHGSNVRAVLMFVRAPKNYRVRLGMDRIAREADAREYLARRVRFRVRQAAGV